MSTPGPWIETPSRTAPGFKARLREPRRWYEIRNVAADEAEILLFDEIGGWGTYADEFVEQLKAVAAPKLTVRLNSPGGSVFEGIALANALRAHPAEVTVQVEGLAASIASIIALAGDRVVMMPHSMIMIHEASGLSIGNASDMRQMAELLDKISDNLADAYAEKAGGTRDEWRSRMLAETWYSADEAVEAGLADEVARPARDEPDEPAMAASWDLSVFRYAGRAAAPAPTAHSQEATVETVPLPAPDPDPQPADEGQVPADPGPAVEQPSAEQEFALFSGQDECLGDLAGEAGPDDWAALVAHLIPPAPPSADDLLAHLREAQ